MIGKEERGDRGDQQQFHDPRLAQRHIGTDRGAKAGQLTLTVGGSADWLPDVNRAHLG